MKITFKLHAMLRDYLPPDAANFRTMIELDVAEGTTVQSVIDQFALPENLVHLVLVDGVYLHKTERTERVLQAGQALAIWPPVAGG